MRKINKNILCKLGFHDWDMSSVEYLFECQRCGTCEYNPESVYVMRWLCILFILFPMIAIVWVFTTLWEIIVKCMIRAQKALHQMTNKAREIIEQ